MAQCSAAAKPYAPAYASCAAACCAASVASFAPGSRLLGVSVIFGALSGLPVLSGIRIIMAHARRTPAS